MQIRPLDFDALDGWVKDHIPYFIRDEGVVAKNADGSKRIILDREWVVQQMYNMTFKDEHEYIVAKFRAGLDAEHLAIFDNMAAAIFTPRSDEVFLQLLNEKRPDGYVPAAGQEG